MGSVRYLMDVRLVSMAYLLLAEYGKLHPCYHVDQPSYLLQKSFSSEQCIHERSCLLQEEVRLHSLL